MRNGIQHKKPAHTHTIFESLSWTRQALLTSSASLATGPGALLLPDPALGIGRGPPLSIPSGIGRGPPRTWPPGGLTSTPPTFWTLHPTTLTPVQTEPTSQTSPSPSPRDTLVTDTTASVMPTATPSGAITDSSSTSPRPTTSSNNSQDASGLGSNRTLVITLSTVLSVVGILLIVGAVLICLKYRRRRLPRFARGISPIDDDEIETWKMSRGEKASLVSAAAAAGPSQGSPGHAKHASASSVKKPPSVIIYPNRQSQTATRYSGEGSPRSMYTTAAYGAGRASLDKELPKTPVQAVAPNARAGLTDETVPGDDPFLPGPRRHPSRLSKAPPVSSPRSIRSQHRRTRSSRSSMRSFGEYGAYYANSEMELSPRASHECLNTHHRSNSRVYLSSSIPPRLSLGDEVHAGGLSPRPFFRENEIGRAIG